MRHWFCAMGVVFLAGLTTGCDGCEEGDDPVLRPCNNAPEIGRPCDIEMNGCARPGVFRCDIQTSQVYCDPDGDFDRMAEVCNGVDDDCDGTTDEGVQNACGGCGDVPPEICNGDDDDCDGTTDEGVQNACGGCGLVPPEVCNRADDDCDGQTDEGVLNACGACGPVPEDVCNGDDDDCDGRTDENLDGAACSAGVGACRDEGQQVCRGAGGLICDAVAGAPMVERCNQVDDDCDGATDELPPQVCSAGRGVCARDGQEICDSGTLICTAEPGPAGDEACNTLDDDCDGVTDETEAGQIGGCDLPNVATYTCNGGDCGIETCVDRYRDEDADPANGCECDDFEDLPDPDGIDSNCDGVDGMANASIFVDPARGNDAANGTINAPVRTLRRALALAVQLDLPVLMAAGEYTVNGGLELLPAGVRLHGGYTRAGGVWSRPFDDTVISGNHQVLRFVGDGTPTLLDALEIRAHDAPNGESSVAVIARGDGLRITGSVLRAGEGGRGSNGQDGGLASPPRIGDPGFAFDNPVCPGCPGFGAQPSCLDTQGGNGGSGAGSARGNADARNGANGGGIAQGLGGQPGPDTQSGEAGGEGRPGANGASSTAGSRLGELEPLNEAWRPLPTLSGGNGRPGGGGGGGGGGGRRANGTGVGGGGAGGGAGGCPGTPGSGAIGGGASIALQVIGGRVELVATRLIARAGGVGGNGGRGGQGLLGADGGQGGAGCVGCGDGGDGGDGGEGGCGGMAGGGAGGHSLPVLRVNLPGAPASVQLVGGANQLQPGAAGAPGAGGARMSCPNVADDGEAGLAVAQACCDLDGRACTTLDACP